MDILYEFQPFVFSSNSQPGRYVEGLTLKTPLGGLLESHGRVCGLFEMRFPEMVPIEKQAKEIIPYFCSLYYGKECPSVHDHLINCLQETQMYLEKSILEFSSIEGLDYCFSVGVVWGSVLYIARFGGAVGLRIYRQDTFGTLFQIDSTAGSHSVMSGSGYIEPGDVIVFYNGQVDQARFPLATNSLQGLDEQHIYARISSYFDSALLTEPGGCVCGVYVREERVPSVEDERIVFKDMDSGHNGSDLEESEVVEDLSAEVLRERHPLFQTPNALRGFRAKISSGRQTP